MNEPTVKIYWVSFHFHDQSRGWGHVAAWSLEELRAKVRDQYEGSGVKIDRVEEICTLGYHPPRKESDPKAGAVGDNDYMPPS